MVRGLVIDTGDAPVTVELRRGGGIPTYRVLVAPRMYRFEVFPGDPLNPIEDAVDLFWDVKVHPSNDA